ncbi:ATP-binding response regulator [Desulfogranum japonicum]|uniref:ATP-binding response regulator n=1 Tax=Desulfogranum japonicum TaxID=231447 RepID=UPI0006889AED|nr:response regulator [Desulfogranum japonicum]
MNGSALHCRQRAVTILAVDDSAPTLQMLSSQLEEEGYSVIPATNGMEAMEIITSSPESIDTILLDRMMPGMDGMEVTRRILQDQRLKYIPIIMQTAADKPEEISEGIKAGVFYYLTKPVERRMLLSVVSSAIKEIEQRRALEAEMKRHHMSFGLISELKSRYKSLEEAESLASFLANCFPDAQRALTGISELLINAVEHGNLGISYDTKTTLLESNQWQGEITKRLQEPIYADKQVEVIFEKQYDTYFLQITDQGNGFDWKKYLQLDPSRASHNHGRGIAMANMLAFDSLIYNQKGNQVTAIMEAKKTVAEP